MKKNVLALSIAAMIGGFAGTASAVVLPGAGVAPAATEGNARNNVTDSATSTMSVRTATDFELSEGGAGHILLVPYFTTQNKNMSVFHVVNTDTKNGKAVKVRFRGAANSDDILDFTLFLSPGDVWTGSVQANDQGSYFYTGDASCTLPDIRKQNQQFVKARLNQGWDAAKQASNTQEGYVEIFNVADIPSDAYYGKGKDAQSSLYTTIKHVNGVAPCDATVLNKTLNQDGDMATEGQLSFFGFNTPTGQLTGDWYILNVDQTTTFSGSATAVKAVVAKGNKTVARGNYVLFPQDNVAVASGDPLTADPLLISKYADKAGKIGQGPLVTPVNYDFPDLSTPYVSAPDTTGVAAAKQAFLLTQAIERSSASNQYAVDAILKAKTDWVFSMPTRRYSVGANYAVATTADNYRVFNLGVNANGQLAAAAQSAAVVGQTPAQAAAELNYFNGSNTSVDKDGNICVSTKSSTFYDREEKKQSSGAIISPGNVTSVAFCGEVSVMSFNEAGDSVLGAKVARSNITNGIYENGWGNINVTTAGNANVKGQIPLMGASFIKLTNSGGLANGFSGTYGITWPHRYGN